MLNNDQKTTAVTGGELRRAPRETTAADATAEDKDTAARGAVSGVLGSGNGDSETGIAAAVELTTPAVESPPDRSTASACPELLVRAVNFAWVSRPRERKGGGVHR